MSTKYITTETNPMYKPGVLFISKDTEALWFKDMLEKGYIKEVEEKEWTNSDMQSYAEWFERCTIADDVVVGDPLKVWVALELRKEDK